MCYCLYGPKGEPGTICVAACKVYFCLKWALCKGLSGWVGYACFTSSEHNHSVSFRPPNPPLLSSLPTVHPVHPLALLQWYLMKDMLDTRRCHPLLLAESRPKAWVDKIPLHGEGRWCAKRWE